MINSLSRQLCILLVVVFFGQGEFFSCRGEASPKGSYFQFEPFNLIHWHQLALV
jgi:hypothetical protein